MACGYADGLILSVDRNAGTLLKEFEGHTRCIFQLLSSPKDSTLVSASEEEVGFRIWNTKTGECTAVVAARVSFIARLDGHDGFVKVASGHREDRAIRIWDIVNG